MDLYEVIGDAEKLANKIQNYSTHQKVLWQKVPLLALNADGRTGYKDTYGLAYDYGFWPIMDQSSGYYSIFVDLETGLLVNAYLASDSLFVDEKRIKGCSNIVPARKEEILKLAFKLEQLNAKEVISNLEKEIKQNYSSFYNPKSQENWRYKIIKLNKLSENYQRIR